MTWGFPHCGQEMFVSLGSVFADRDRMFRPARAWIIMAPEAH